MGKRNDICEVIFSRYLLYLHFLEIIIYNFYKIIKTYSI